MVKNASTQDIEVLSCLLTYEKWFVKYDITDMAKAKKTSKINLQPTPGYVLIEPQEAESKTKAGIYLPDSAEGEKPLKGKVLVVGEAEVLDSGKTRKSPVKKGDSVFYKKWGGSEVKIEEKEYLFAKFEDILAVEK